MDEVNNKKKILILFVAIIAFLVVMASGTYAWLSITGALVSSNGNTMATCFMVDENFTNDDGTINMEGTLIPSSKPSGGLSGSVGMKINASCGISGVGHIKMNVYANSDYELFKKAEAHCENKKTLETMDYGSSSTCSANGGTWVAANTHSALKYAVYEEGGIEPVSVGYIDEPGYLYLHQNIPLSYTNKRHNIYIWLDGELTDNSYIDAFFEGYIHLEANQTEELPTITGDAYAIYSADDNSLRFYRSETPITGSTYNGRTVSEVYTGFETATYTSGNQVPWYSNSIYTVVLEDLIQPVSTAYWFYNMEVKFVDVSKLDTSKVTNMSNMFAHTYFLENIIGLDGFDVSQVTDMREMFLYSGSHTTFMKSPMDFALESWDTSNVANMFDMFSWAYVNVDLSSWNVCKVNNYNNFYDAEDVVIVKPYFGDQTKCNGGSYNPDVRTITINTTVLCHSNYTSISLYINGEKQYTTPTTGTNSQTIYYNDTYENVYEAYIKLESTMSGYSVATVNGTSVFQDNPTMGMTYDLLALGTDNIEIQTEFAY